MNRFHRGVRRIAALAAVGFGVLAANLSWSVSAVALSIAAAAALGVFDSKPDVRPTQSPAAAALHVPFSYTPEPSVGPLVVTYYLVDSKTAAEAMLVTESQLVNREWLRKNDIEVLLVVDEASEDRALRAFEAAKRRSPTSVFELVDLRQ